MKNYSYKKNKFKSKKVNDQNISLKEINNSLAVAEAITILTKTLMKGKNNGKRYN